jgi:hypothetical protein
MGFLAPLYIAGFLAISLPILFHLMRRSPRGKQVFSSLMFLQQSPPRLTKRSRLDNILLLILRAAAFVLLAVAFARPFFSWGSAFDTYQSTGHRTALLLDTSASMQRGDLWTQAKAQAAAALGHVQPTDEVAVYAFDSAVRPIFTFDEWNRTPVGERLAAVKARLETVTPTWMPTRLGDALATAADFAAESVPVAGANGKTANDKLRREVVLISDLQAGSRAETLQGHQWPANVLLEVMPVALKNASNASVQWVKQAEGTESADAAGREGGGGGAEKLRVRVANEADATKENFTLTWANATGPLKNIQPQKVYCPPGHSQIVRVAWPNDGQVPDRLVLGGDDADFDNTLYLVPPRSERVRVIFYGEEGPDDVKGAQFYLQSALGDTPQRKMEYLHRSAARPLVETDLLDTRLVVVTTPPPAAVLPALRKFAENGGGILWLLKDAAAGQEAVRFLNKPGTPIAVTEAVPERGAGGGGFVLISRFDAGNPLFAPFADPRFGDFTKIHFWKHRKLKLPAAGEMPADLHVLAWFDNGDPFLIEQPVGKGWVRIAASTWTPADSQLALSTKFVPLLEGFISRRDLMAGGSQYVLGEPVSLLMSGEAAATQPGAGGTGGATAMAQATQPATRPAGGTGGAPVASNARRVMIAPDGRRIELLTNATTFEGADRPGIYRLAWGGAGGQEIPLAVNVPLEESRTAALPADSLERWGAKLVKAEGRGQETAAETATRERRLQLAELENRQKVWRWLILCVLLLLAAETFLAGRLSLRVSKEA